MFAEVWAHFSVISAGCHPSRIASTIPGASRVAAKLIGALRGAAVLCGDVLAQRSSDHGLHGFDEVSPRVDGPSLIETDRFKGCVNHGVGRLRKLCDDGIGYAGTAVYVIGSAPASGLSNSTCRSFTKSL